MKRDEKNEGGWMDWVGEGGEGTARNWEMGIGNYKGKKV